VPRFSWWIGFLIAGAACATTSQRHGAISGTVRYASGVAAAGVTVRALVDTSNREARVDSSGAFRLESLPTGSRSIAVVCAGDEVAEPIPYSAAVRVSAREDASLTIVLPIGACEPIPTRDVRINWRGWYSEGFELSRFWPCPTDSVALEVRRYGNVLRRGAWVAVDNPWGADNLGRMVDHPRTGGRRGFVHWSGILRGPGDYGHGGVATYHLTVDSIFAVAPEGVC
jgi:hypothetical protein